MEIAVFTVDWTVLPAKVGSKNDENRHHGYQLVQWAPSALEAQVLHQ
jgi:hypothetical protein